jgi:hypothetical protein
MIIFGVLLFAQIFEGHALLQRMATLLGLTLEINHFFVSMFGGPIVFVVKMKFNSPSSCASCPTPRPMATKRSWSNPYSLAVN